MKVAASLIALILFNLLQPRAAAQALQVDMEEVKRLAGQVADLREANQAQQRRIRDLQAQVESLRSALRESSDKQTTRLGDFVTRDDLKKIVDSIREVDEKREADKKLILEQIAELGKKLTAPVETLRSPRDGGRTPPRNNNGNTEKPAAPYVGEVFEYKVEKDEVFSKIVSDWNAILKEKGRKTVTYDDVKRANPTLNINRIFEGQKILLPLPDKK